MAFFTIRRRVFGTTETEQQIITQHARIAELEKDNRVLEQQVLDRSNRIDGLEKELSTAKKAAKQLRRVLADLTVNNERAILQQGRDLTARITELSERCVGLTAARDTAQANFEWARLMFNKGEAERAILTSRIIERPVQPFSIEREAAPPPPTDGTAGKAGEVPAGVDRPKPTAALETAIGGLANRFGVIFDDVGDDEAKAQGIDHEPAV